jgi:hypothetical protein
MDQKQYQMVLYTINAFVVYAVLRYLLEIGGLWHNTKQICNLDFWHLGEHCKRLYHNGKNKYPFHSYFIDHHFAPLEFRTLEHGQYSETEPEKTT